MSHSVFVQHPDGSTTELSWIGDSLDDQVSRAMREWERKRVFRDEYRAFVERVKESVQQQADTQVKP